MLLALSLISILICIGITWYSATTTPTKEGQTIKDSMLEAWENILVGFTVNFIANLFVIPMMMDSGEGVGFLNNFLGGWIYTAISMIRSMWIRRRYNAKMLRAAQA
jgi:hypothetical protein